MIPQTPPPLHDIAGASISRSSWAVIIRSGSDGIRASAPGRVHIRPR